MLPSYFGYEFDKFNVQFDPVSVYITNFNQCKIRAIVHDSCIAILTTLLFSGCSMAWYGKIGVRLLQWRTSTGVDSLKNNVFQA